MHKLKKIDAVKRLVVVNSIVGKKEDEGYRFLPDVGLSVQGQDANAAWKAALHVAKNLGCEIDVTVCMAKQGRRCVPRHDRPFQIQRSLREIRSRGLPQMATSVWTSATNCGAAMLWSRCGLENAHLFGTPPVDYVSLPVEPLMVRVILTGNGAALSDRPRNLKPSLNAS